MNLRRIPLTMCVRKRDRPLKRTRASYVQMLNELKKNKSTILFQTHIR